MKPEGFPFFAIIVAIFLGIVWWWRSYDNVTFDEPERMQFNQPQVEKDGTRFGRRTRRMLASDIERYSLVRYKTKRSGVEVTARVIAVEGERVRIEGAEVFVDGNRIKDPYRRRTSDEEYYPELIVPTGCVFVVTDGRNTRGADRWDSRNLGPIPLGAISHVFSAREQITGKGLR